MLCIFLRHIIRIFHMSFCEPQYLISGIGIICFGCETLDGHIMGLSAANLRVCQTWELKLLPQKQ